MLLKFIQEEKKYKKEFDDALNKYNEYYKSLKTEKNIYNDIKITLSKLRANKYNKERKYNKAKFNIAYFPIIPLIIPTPIDIN